MVEGNRDEPLTSDAAAERLAESLISTVYRLCVKNVRKMFDLVLTALRCSKCYPASAWAASHAVPPNLLGSAGGTKLPERVRPSKA